jgi:hypothetical protein
MTDIPRPIALVVRSAERIGWTVSVSPDPGRTWTAEFMREDERVSAQFGASGVVIRARVWSPEVRDITGEGKRAQIINILTDDPTKQGPPHTLEGG